MSKIGRSYKIYKFYNFSLHDITFTKFFKHKDFLEEFFGFSVGSRESDDFILLGLPSEYSNKFRDFRRPSCDFTHLAKSRKLVIFVAAFK